MSDAESASRTCKPFGGFGDVAAELNARPRYCVFVTLCDGRPRCHSPLISRIALVHQLSSDDNTGTAFSSGSPLFLLART